MNLGARDVGHHPPSHRAGILDEAVPGGGLPHPGLDHRLELEPERVVPGGRACFQQRLELPGLRPLGVIAAVGGDGAHEGSVLPLGAEVRIDLPQRALTGALGAGPGELAGQGRADRDDVSLPLITVLRALCGGDDMHDVDVGDVVELAGTGLAERDHRPAHLLVAFDGRPRDRRAGLERRIGKVADRGGDAGLERCRVRRADVRGSDLREPAVIGDAQGISHLAAAVTGDGDVRRGICPDGLEQGAPDLGRGHRELVVALAQQAQMLGMARQEVSESNRGAQQGDEAMPGCARRPDAAEEPLHQRLLPRLLRGFGQSQQAQHRVVAVGGAAQGPGGVAAESGQGRFGEEAAHSVGAAEAEAREGPGGGRRFAAHVLFFH